MAIPKYYEIHKPFLGFLMDEKEHTRKELKELITKYFKLSEEEQKQLLPSGRQTVFNSRFDWAYTYLNKAGLVIKPSRGIYSITKEGLGVIKEKPQVIDNKYLMRFESFKKFINKENDVNNKNIIDESTPDDEFEEAFKKINDNLTYELLQEVLKISPTAFEQMVIDLLSKMGYGAFENAGKTTAITGDGGIDGIIMEDKLGFNLIYIQAKKWDKKNSIGRPDIQKFVGAISGKGGKGLFVTTANFSMEAIKYAEEQHIILIDGNKLTDLMIEHNFGVTTKKVFKIKTIDTDIFNEYA